MVGIRNICASAVVAILVASCSEPAAQQATPPANHPAVIATSFAYPVGNAETVTQAKDTKDDWINALDFGKNDHLGEDWNKNSGGNTDCGEPVSLLRMAS